MRTLYAAAPAPKIAYQVGDRVVVNKGTGDKPAFYTGVLTRKLGTKFDVEMDMDGEVLRLPNNGSKVGLVGISYSDTGFNRQLTKRDANVVRDPKYGKRASERTHKISVKQKPPVKSKGAKSRGKALRKPQVPTMGTKEGLAFVQGLARSIVYDGVAKDDVLRSNEDVFSANPEFYRTLDSWVNVLSREKEAQANNHFGRGGDHKTRKERGEVPDTNKSPSSRKKRADSSEKLSAKDFAKATRALGKKGLAVAEVKTSSTVRDIMEAIELEYPKTFKANPKLRDSVRLHIKKGLDSVKDSRSDKDSFIDRLSTDIAFNGKSLDSMLELYAPRFDADPDLIHQLEVAIRDKQSSGELSEGLTPDDIFSEDTSEFDAPPEDVFDYLDEFSSPTSFDLGDNFDDFYR